MKKNILISIFSFFSLLFPREYKFSTDLHINKILKANLNQMNFIFIYEENSDFKIYIGENDGLDFLFVDKQSVTAVKKFVDAINKKAAEGQYVKEISIYNGCWVFNYDDCFLTLAKQDHFIFREEKYNNRS
ncbi:MAG: hypothetical protein IK024_09305 [Treponema sp.]|nr:hypothetical protein [Treponema sp.]